MNTYIALMNLTAEGVKTMHDSAERSVRGKALMKKIGGRIKDYYMTMGSYDFVVVFEAPSDEAMTLFLLEVGSWGAVRTNTLKAFTKPQYLKILSALGASKAPARKKRKR